jgi:hypothetical protein
VNDGVTRFVPSPVTTWAAHVAVPASVKKRLASIEAFERMVIRANVREKPAQVWELCVSLLRLKSGDAVGEVGENGDCIN